MMQQYSRSNPGDKIRKRMTYIGLISILPFLYFAVVGYFDWADVTGRDYEIGSFFYGLREPMRTTIATGITRLADFEAQVLVSVAVVLILMVLKKWRIGLWYGLTVLIGSGFINGGVKALYQRARPTDIEHLIEQGGYAFPSGHSMGSMIVYGGILFLLIRYLSSKRQNYTWLKWGMSLLIGLMILSIGLSRIYLGVHYPSDVIAGFSLGFAWLSLSIAALGLKVTRKEFQTSNRYRFMNY